ncbi:MULTISPECIES: phosphate signaling complex protein PhoU [Paenibacillus]|uniref:Phosphate-specific transport system accessory protein PhoU n=1 Tax=Paenibacillus arenosi TaxID=2774142 RepID=A0ABR9B1G1_9BACL|nr:MULTISPECIES: phosphate signaling complex protein PhoU [Paenibacillus]MBD8500215.1 phosphate signaling complex protein PhoU [Paenibacillus arenosi]
MIQRRDFDLALGELSTLLEEMGRRVERALVESVESLKTQDVARAKEIIEKDAELNQLENDIMDIGSKLILTQQPVAKDLRRILVAFRIASDLERMGDLSIDIAKVVVRLEGQPLIKELVDIPRMAEIVQKMIEDSIKAYEREDVDLAYKMAKEDDLVDQLYGQILRDLYQYIVENPHNASQVMLLNFVGRYIERIADHATNIGESVVYLVTNSRPDLNS